MNPTYGFSADSRNPDPKTAVGWQNVYFLPLALTILFLGFVLFPSIRTSPKLAWTFVAMGGGLLVWQVGIWIGVIRAGRRFHIEYRPVKSHYVQGMVQLCVYAYWGWYWRKVYTEAPLILAQVVFLYVFDALLSWSRGRAWRLGFGPFPIIFSTNLFMWFVDDWFVFQFLMIATGALAKEFIRWRRDGKQCHIFNPSAFGLALFSLALIIDGTGRYTWGWEIATTLGRPRFIYVEVFLLGLIVQGFFGVTLVTLSATATLCLANLIYTHVTGVYFFVDSNIPIAVFLGLHLLVTDPATSPRSNIGKAIFGSLYGLGVWLSYAVLRQFGLPEFYDKLLVVPILNLGVQLLDHLAAWQPLREFGCWETGFGLRKLNAIHMGCWGLIFMAMLGTGFVEAPQPGMSIAFWQKAAEEGRPHAAENLITKLTFLSYQGVGDACRELGHIYAEGRLTKGDPAASARFYAQAREIYTKGCAQGEPIACRSLAQMELAGEGGPQDPAAAERTLAMLVPPSHLLDPGLMRKMRLVLARFGKDVDMDPGLSARMGFTGDNQPWMTRQVAGSVPAQPGNRHSFSMSRDDNQPDILIGLHTTTRLYIVRSHPDGTSVPGYALVTDAQSGQTLPLSADEAQACLNEEFDFWSRIADQLLSTPSQK